MSEFPLRFSTSNAPATDIDADWLVVGVPSGGDLSRSIETLDQRTGSLLSRLRTAGDLTGKSLELIPILSPTSIQADRLLLVGIGPAEKLTRAAVHDSFAAALRSITRRKVGRVALVVPEVADGSARAATLGATVGAVQGCFGPGLRKAEPSRFAPDELVVVGEGLTEDLLRRVRAEAAAITLARELVNLPPCDLYPESFAARAADLPASVEREVWDETRLEAERMGAILGVARGAARPPRLLILRYRNGAHHPHWL